MRKLKLSLDTLRVESFDTALSRDDRGTVRGAEHTFGWDCETLEHPWCGYQTYEIPNCGDHAGTSGSSTVSGDPSGCGGNTCLYASCDGYTC